MRRCPLPCCARIQVRSRFAASERGGEDFGPFLGALRALGFELVKQDAGNTMFVVFVLRKAKAQQQQQQQAKQQQPKWPVLRPCVYKKR